MVSGKDINLWFGGATQLSKASLRDRVLGRLNRPNPAPGRRAVNCEQFVADGSVIWPMKLCDLAHGFSVTWPMKLCDLDHTFRRKSLFSKVFSGVQRSNKERINNNRFVVVVFWEKGGSDA